MKLILLVGSKAWQLDLSLQRLATEDDDEGSVAFEAAPPIDPHGTLSAQVGHGAGADSYQTDVSAGRKKFGFGHGPQA
jgi:hypothetical protein